MPTFTIETKWQNEAASLFGLKITSPQPYRTSYYAMDVSGKDVYGSCESWNSYLVDSLRTTHESKRFTAMSLIVESGEVGLSPRSPPAMTRNPLG
jgi:hypothetical protein